MQTTTAITWFEIPAKDLERAVWFYESILQQDLQRSTMGPAAMALLPDQRVTRAGGRVVLDETALPDGLGVFAHILDCEGNRVGLHALD